MRNEGHCQYDGLPARAFGVLTLLQHPWRIAKGLRLVVLHALCPTEIQARAEIRTVRCFRAKWLRQQKEDK